MIHRKWAGVQRKVAEEVAEQIVDMNKGLPLRGVV